MQLAQTATNTIPEGAQVMRITARDGAPLRVAFWPARSEEPLGTICILQGRAEFIEKYCETVEELLARGFAVVTFDWRGQGRSYRALRQAKKGHIGSFRHFHRDMQAIRERVLERLCPRPHFGLAHSMGGAIALDLARRGISPFERMVLSAPMLGLVRLGAPRRTAILTQTLSWMGLGRLWIPGGGATSQSTRPFDCNLLTSDPARYARNADLAAALGDGAIGEPTIGWVAAAFRVMTQLQEPRAALDIRIPTLILAAGADEIVDTRATERFGQGLKGGGVIILPGARHEILMERDAIREQFWAAFDNFIPGTHLREEVQKETGAS
ncbi:MAG: alpha/beta hydrolase [Salinarimonas sp.]|nr:alpha/beta hydrolase [Salinarimonas sp.]